MRLQRFKGNPILSPLAAHPWENLAVFNPAAWYDEKAGEVLLLYRSAESGPEYKCWFGLARSQDGFHFTRESDQPCFSPSVEGFDGATLQDPRIVKMGDWFYVTYACRHFPFGQFWKPEVRARFLEPGCPQEFPRCLRLNATFSGLAMTKDFKSWIRAGWLTDPLLDDRDAILFPEKVNGKFVLLNRPLEWVGPAYGADGSLSITPSAPTSSTVWARSCSTWFRAGHRLLPVRPGPVGGGQRKNARFEEILPRVLHRDYIPVGFKGILIAALLASFMSTFVS